jgi:hypothetical protein
MIRLHCAAHLVEVNSASDNALGIRVKVLKRISAKEAATRADVENALLGPGLEKGCEQLELLVARFAAEPLQ